MEQLRVPPLFFRHVGERFHIFGEARAAVAQTRFEEEGANARVVAHPNGNLFHIRAEFFADVGNFVDERNFCRQKRVGGVLYHFGGAEVGDDDGGAKRQVELGHLLGGFLVGGAQHNAVRVHKIAERRAFAQKFGARHHREGNRLGLVMGDDVGNPIACAHWHGGFVYHDQRRSHVLSNALGRGFHIAQIGLAICP